jgi:hypothetical protein
MEEQIFYIVIDNNGTSEKLSQLIMLLKLLF